MLVSVSVWRFRDRNKKSVTALYKPLALVVATQADAVTDIRIHLDRFA